MGSFCEEIDFEPIKEQSLSAVISFVALGKAYRKVFRLKI
jgi:hypothetical protein